MRACNNCEWVGLASECVHLGDIGPLCPECNETTHESRPRHKDEFDQVVMDCDDHFKDVAERMGCYAYFLHGVELGKTLAENKNTPQPHPEPTDH